MHKAWPELLKRMKANKVTTSDKERQLVVSARTWFCLYLFEHQYLAEGEEPAPDTLDQIETLIQNRNFATHPFYLTGPETTNATDEEFLELVRLGQHHCQRGDVFQIVLSRRFAQGFQGDEFNVYRALRSLNPSPYLFFFDYGGYKLFGSSPESQIVIRQGEAVLYPIAGTFRRTGDDAADARLAQQLLDDPKETAEHVMLVDLARNDLSRRCDVVQVERFKEIQYYSHVIHLVSKVVGQLGAATEPLDVVGETFPAGTLSGAPKYRAVQLIDEYESTQRGFYGGCLGVLDFGGDFNHAIMIRTFLSKDNTLYYQAGAGVVAKSVPESELCMRKLSVAIEPRTLGSARLPRISAARLIGPVRSKASIAASRHSAAAGPL